MSMQNYINVGRRVVRWYVLQTKLQSASHNIDEQWPCEITVAISPHDRDWGPNCAKLVENDLCANITQMPDFISIFRDFPNAFRQAIMRVRQDENAQEFAFRFKAF